MIGPSVTDEISWDDGVIGSTSTHASTTRLDVLFRVDTLERGLQSRDWALGVLGIIAGHIATHATRPS